MRPLTKALRGASGWITGLRRGQSSGRAEVPFAVWDAGLGLVKVNPIADWDLARLQAYIAANEIPVNPLHAQGFPSIGCQPCTRAIRPGEDIRAGRWWWRTRTARSADCTTARSRRLSPHERDGLPPRSARGREHPHLPRGGGAVPQAGAALFDRQGLHRPLAPGAQGVLSRAAALPGAAHRHDVEVPRHDRLPRPHRRRARPRPHRAYEQGRSGARHRPDPPRAFDLHRRHEDAGPEAGARSARLRRGLRRRASRRGGLARQGARVLVPRPGPPLGPAQAAAGDVAAAQRPAGRRRDRPHLPALQLDREGRVALHRARGPRRGAALLRRRAPDDRAQRPAARARRRPPAARRGREAEDAARALPHARLLALDRRRAVGRRGHPAVVAETLAARTSERQGRLIDHDQSGAMERKKQEGYF